jgi:hypothetical protein
MDASSPARKTQAHEIHEKNWKNLEHLRCAMASTGRYEEVVHNKAEAGGLNAALKTTKPAGTPGLLCLGSSDGLRQTAFSL